LSAEQKPTTLIFEASEYVVNGVSPKRPPSLLRFFASSLTS
jgi:hypothetical protein